MSRLSDLVSQAIVETEKGDGRRPFASAAALVVQRADDNDLNLLAHEGARLRCKKAAEKQGPAARRAASSSGQTSLFPDLHRGYAVDGDDSTIKLTGSLKQIEFRRVIAVREKQIGDDAAHLKSLRNAYDAVRPIWDAHPDWTFDQCCHDLASRRKAS